MNERNPHVGCENNEDSGALRVDLALTRMLESVNPVRGFEQVGLLEASGRVLHEPIVARFDVPFHTNSAVDGYALRGAELPSVGESKEFEVVGLARAGRPYGRALEPGQACAVMTGALLPEGADTVLMEEQVELVGGRIRVRGGYRRGENIRWAGEDLRCGSTPLQAGQCLRAPEIGLIASLGIGEVKVKRRPRVALMSTGDEVYALGRPLEGGGVYDSNRYTLQSALRRINVKVMDQGIVPDDPELLREALLRAAGMADVVISTGGVSVGAADYIRDVIGTAGKIEFWRVSMKPGRPLAFGHIGSALFLGLPGNPVAALVCYLLFVLPVLERKMGMSEVRPIPTFAVEAGEPLPKKPGRTEFQRGVLVPAEAAGWRVRKAGPQGSGILSSMSLADVLIVLDHDRGPVQAGERVDVIPFQPYL